MQPNCLLRFGTKWNGRTCRIFLLGTLGLLPVLGWAATEAKPPNPPYPPSPIIQGITWHWDTHRTAAPGSDLWPVTWGPAGHLYVAWGDGGGFGGSNSDGRVSMGFARIEGGPENFRGVNVNGGKNPEHPASFPRKGKTGGILSVDGTLYARVNLQDGPWPDVNHVLAWSTNRGATWAKADWFFPKGLGNFQPAKFLNFGQDYTGLPAHLAGFVYVYGPRQATRAGDEKQLFLTRVPSHRLRERTAYEFFGGLGADGQPIWTANAAKMQPVFSDANGVTPGTVVYNPGIKRFLLTYPIEFWIGAPQSSRHHLKIELNPAHRKKFHHAAILTRPAVNVTHGAGR